MVDDKLAEALNDVLAILRAWYRSEPSKRASLAASAKALTEAITAMKSSPVGSDEYRTASAQADVSGSLLSLALFCALSATARPGGGNSYSGGSHYSSSGGGGGSSDAAGILFQLILLCINYPAIGVPLLIIVVIFFVAKSATGALRKNWSTTTAAEGTAPSPFSQLQLTRHAANHGI